MAYIRCLFPIIYYLGFNGILQSRSRVSAKSCDGKNGCCAGFTWDTALKACRKCTNGYFGVNCSQPCLYPYYGENCSAKCQCAENLCNNTFGCFENQSITESDLRLLKGTTCTIEASSSNGKTADESTATTEHMFSFSLDRFIVMISLISVGIALLLIFIITTFLLYKRTQNNMRNHFMSAKTGQKYLVGLENESNIQKLIQGTANISMIYDKESATYLLEIQTTDKQMDQTESQYLISEETRRVPEDFREYESITLTTAGHLVDERLNNDAGPSSEYRDECDTNLKEVSIQDSTENILQSNQEKSEYLTVY